MWCNQIYLGRRVFFPGTTSVVLITGAVKFSQIHNGRFRSSIEQVIVITLLFSSKIFTVALIHITQTRATNKNKATDNILKIKQKSFIYFPFVQIEIFVQIALVMGGFLQFRKQPLSPHYRQLSKIVILCFVTDENNDILLSHR